MGVIGKSFIYNGQSSEDFGVMLVSVGAETSDYSNLGYTVSKSSLNSHRNKVYAHSRMYTDVLSFTISIVKKNLSKFTQTEKRTISRWLTSPRT